MSELKFQNKSIKSLKADGNLVQKFTDQFSLGIPDTYIANPDAAVWAELKWCNIPKRPLTPLNLRHFTGPQRAWLTRHNNRPHICCALIGTPKGWFTLTPPLYTQLLKLNTTLITPFLKEDPVTFLNLYKSIKQCEIILDKIS